MSTEQADIYDELLPKIGDWKNEELWPDEKLGYHFLMTIMVDEAQRQGIALDDLSPEVGAMWIAGLQDCHASFPNAALESAAHRLTDRDFAGAGALLRRYVLFGACNIWEKEVVGKASARVAKLREYGRRGGNSQKENNHTPARKALMECYELHELGKLSNLKAAEIAVSVLKLKQKQTQTLRKIFASFPKTAPLV